MHERDLRDNASLGFSVNAHAVQARACAAERALFIHVSADHAFGGDVRSRCGKTPRRSTSMAQAMGETLAGLRERRHPSRSFPVRDGGSERQGGNFVETIAGKEKGALRAVDDQTMSPTATAARVVLRILANGCASGIYHAVNGGAATWSPAKSSASPEPS